MTYQQIIKSSALILLVAPFSGFILPSFAEDSSRISTEKAGGLQSIVNASASKEAQVWLQRIVDAPRLLHPSLVLYYLHLQRIPLEYQQKQRVDYKVL